MSVAYSDLLAQAVQELLTIVRQMSAQGPSLSSIRRLKFIAGFIGIQKITDLGFWLEDWLESGGAKRKPLSQEVRDNFCHLMEDILAQVEPPQAFGEYVNAEGIVQRPLFRREVPVHKLFRQLREIHPIQFLRRNILRLPINLSETHPFALRLPSRFLERSQRDAYLALLFVDLGKSTPRSWTDLADLFHQLTTTGIILTQGVMEVPLEFMHNRKAILPYYILYGHDDDPVKFLSVNGLSGHVMRVLKNPGEVWKSTGEALDNDEETLWDEYDLESYEGEGVTEVPPAPPRNRISVNRTGEGLLATAQGLKTDVPHIIHSPAPEEFFVDDSLEGLGDLSDPFAQDQSDPLPSLITEAAPRSPQEAVRPTKTTERLTEIPFTLADLSRPDFSWPKGLDGLDFSPPAVTRQSPAAPIEGKPKMADLDPVSDWDLPSGTDTVKKTKSTPVPIWSDHLDDFSETHEMLNSQGTKKSLWGAFWGITALVLTLGIAYLGFSYQQTLDRNLVRTTQEEAIFLGLLVEKELAWAESAAALFMPSVEGLSPDNLEQDFFRLFFPATGVVAGIGFKTQDGTLFYPRDKEGSAVKEKVIESSGALGLKPLEGTSYSILTQSRTTGEDPFWLLDWKVLPEAGPDQGFYLFTPDGKVLSASGGLGKKDFILPPSLFLPSTESGAFEYQDTAGISYIGGYRRTAGNGIAVVLRTKSDLFKTLLTSPIWR